MISDGLGAKSFEGRPQIGFATAWVLALEMTCSFVHGRVPFLVVVVVDEPSSEPFGA